MAPSQGASNILRLAVTLLLLTGWAAGANAADELQKMLVRMPALASKSGILFDFLAPRVVRDWPAVAIPAAGQEPVRRALLQPAPATALTGIDFAKLGGIIVFGEPPEDVLFLTGPIIDGNAAKAAFSARGFESSVEAGTAVYAKGEDLHLDLDAVDPADPFGKDMGKSERVAVGPLGVIEAAAWGPLRANLALIDDAAKRTEADRAAGALYADMAAAGAAASGSQAYAASGFDARVLAQSFDLLERDKQVRKARTGPLQAFLYAFLIASAGNGREAAQIVLAYKSRGDAGAGIAEVARRLAAFEKQSPRAGTAIATSIAPSSTGEFTIAVATLIFPASDDHLSEQALSYWLSAIYNRGFSVLDLSP